jgi:peptide chain release factor subunit 1
MERDELRRLSDTRLAHPRVLSLYLDLRPSEFATPAARASAVRSLLDDAERRVRDGNGLSREDRRDLERSLARARAELESAVRSAEGTRGLALFASEGAGLLEVVRLPHEVESQVVIDRSPHVAPLAGAAGDGDWCVALVSRRVARLLRGTPDRLIEVEELEDDVHGQHDQGGWSQARYQRSVEKEVADHLRRAAGRLLRHLERRPFRHLLVGGPEELVPDFERTLHPYVAERLAGRVEVDVENTSPDEVRDAARPAMEELERRLEREALDRLAEGSASAGRAASGLEAVLRALNERRVGLLLLEERLAAPGVVCPRCGWLGPHGVGECPVDGTAVERREDLVELVVERALQQSAEVRRVRHHDDLAGHGGIGALLRF